MPTPPPTEKILVVGDVTLDWLEQTIVRTEQKAAGSRRNYELYNPGFHSTAVWGGAALLQRLVKSALDARNMAFRKAGVQKPVQIKVQKLTLPQVGHADARKYVQSLALIAPMSPDGKPGSGSYGFPIRVAAFKGFSAASGGPKSEPRVMTVSPRETPSKLACLVIDDAANGCRWDKNFIAGIRRYIPGAASIVIKLNRPLDGSELLHTVLKSSAARVVGIINADDLRAEGVDLSRRLSWERTAQDLMLAVQRETVLQRLSRVRALMVRLGSDGCILLTPKTKHLIFDPHGTEDAFDNQLKGTMPGATSAFVASVVARLREPEADLVDLARHGLAASRRLLTQGFIDLEAGDAAPARPAGLHLAQPDYPLDVFNEDDGQADAFKTERLPSGIPHPNWSVLIERLEVRSDDERSLPERIALIGPDALKNIPSAQYGKLLLVDRREIEGYRSIENLLREYIRSRPPKPLSIAVFGPPGSGKSFGIKQLAEHISATLIKSHEFNLTQLQKPSDLIGAFHTARDDSLRGCMPLLIFDEFDCNFEGERRGWLKYFLAPMQDGVFKDEELVHPLGSAIFVFAGGTADRYDTFNRLPPAPGKSKERQRELREFEKFQSVKGPDFVSRLKGYVDVQGISEMTGDPACVVRRAVLLRSLLDKDERAGNLFRIIGKERILQIEMSVLIAFLQVRQYKHGARSLEAIITMSRLMGADRYAASSLPSDEQLKLHVSDDFTTLLKSYSAQHRTDWR